MKKILILLSFILIVPIVSALKPGEFLMTRDDLVNVTYPCVIMNENEIYIASDAPQGDQWCDISYNKYVSGNTGSSSGSHKRDDIPDDYNSTLPWYMGGSRNLIKIETTTTTSITTTTTIEMQETTTTQTPSTTSTTITATTTTTTLEVVTETVPVNVDGTSQTTIIVAVAIVGANIVAAIVYWYWKKKKKEFQDSNKVAYS